MTYKPPIFKPSYEDLYQWYWITNVKFNMIKFMKFRESAMIVPHWCDPEMQKKTRRMLKIHNVQGLDFCIHLLQLKKCKVPFNFYYSLLEYEKGIPHQDKEDIKFGTQDKNWWKEHWKHAVGFDCMIDIDAGEHEEMEFAYDSASTIKTFFNELCVPYELRFSGKGFHFIIPHEYLPKLDFDPDGKKTIYNYCARISKFLAKNFSELVDTSIYDSRRLCKVPYTVACYELDEFVAFPFVTESEFEKFKLSKYRKDRLPFEIYNRGTHIFNESGNVRRLENSVFGGEICDKKKDLS